MGLADIIETTTGFDSHLLRAFHSAICPQIAKSCGATLIDLGYADAKRYLSNCKLEGLALASEVTRMKDTNIGITFREMMKGPFALGAIEPHAGEAAGRAAGTTLAMHATILIDDLDAFIGERSHLGRIAGRIDFPPFGEEIPATRGIFNLFSSAEDSRAKLMVYELAFEHNDKRYYLAGHKKLKDDLGFGLWKDTTTLFTTLHCGDDKSGSDRRSRRPEP